MATNTLNNRTNGQTIDESFFNQIHTALNGEFVGRNATGVPTASQSLGSVALPWGTGRFNSVVINGQAIDPAIAAIPQNVVISGATRAGSLQPLFITPSGAGLSLTVEGAPTALTYDVNGTSVSLSADVVKSSLTAAPSSNNTALVNDVDAAGQHDTRTWGEYGHRKTITIDTVGSEISALVGKWAAFKIVGGSTEYFLARVKSATELDQCMRGYFFSPAGLPIKRTTFSNNDTISLMKLGFLFAENDGVTVDVTYTNPSWSFDAPTGPATSDYWYDIPNEQWKRYDGASWQVISRTYIGMFVNDTTDCVAARGADFYTRHDEYLNFELERQSTEIAVASSTGNYLEVYGKILYFGGVRLPQWNITTDLASSADMYTASETASRVYYLYISNTGETVMSDISPHWRPELKGWYHTHQTWRCVGGAFNNASSDLVSAEPIVLSQNYDNQLFVNLSTNPALSANDPIIFDEVINSSLGGYDATTGEFTVTINGTYLLQFTGSSSGSTQLYFVNLVTGDTRYMTSTASGEYGHGSLTMKLLSGETFQIKSQAAVTISGNPYPANAAVTHFYVTRLK